MTEMTAVVSGSFNRNVLPLIQNTVHNLGVVGVRVIAPRFQNIEGEGTTFPVLDTDDHTKSPRELEQAYLTAIGEASLHITANPINGRIGRSSAAEYAYAAVNGVARAVTTISKITSRDHPEIWFDGLSPADEDSLQRLSWTVINPYTIGAIDRGLLDYINRAEPLPDTHPDRQTLVGIYEQLLADLPDTPLGV